MVRHKVVSREYKVMLQAARFVGDEGELRKRVKTFWGDFRTAVKPVVLAIRGKPDDVAKRRRIRFFDTSDLTLRRNGYVFRERIGVDGVDRQTTLKFRHPDRYLAGDRDMRSKVSAKLKFEEDIKPPQTFSPPYLSSLFSYSCTREISNGKKLVDMKDVAGLYPGLKKRLDVYDKTRGLVEVNDFTARELVLVGSFFDVGRRPEVKCECAVIVWYDDRHRGRGPAVVEFSFRYGHSKEKYDGDAARRAFDVLRLLQTDLTAWTDPNSLTKTSFVFERAGQSPG